MFSVRNSFRRNENLRTMSKVEVMADNVDSVLNDHIKTGDVGSFAE